MEADNSYREADQVSFASLVRAAFEAQRAEGMAANLDATSKAFTKRFGPIIYSRFGTNISCGVALTDTKSAADRNLAVLSRSAGVDDRSTRLKWFRTRRWERRWWRQERKLWLTEQRKPVHLHLALPAPGLTAAQVLGLLSRCETQAVYARRFLQDEDLRQCLVLLYWPADALIALADTDAAGPAPEKPAASNVLDSSQPATTAPTTNMARNDPNAGQTADVVNTQLDAANQYYQYFTQRTIRMAYFRGIAYGILAVVGLFVILYVFRGFFKAPIALLWSIMAGALGALTSVLSNATFGRIVLDRASGGNWNTLLGAFRPIIGALFGAAFFILVSAGFLPIKIPSGNTIALYASIAFLAGFSHRWAQDTFRAAEGRISPPPSAPASAMEQEATAKPAQQKA